jgi:hypothetical protein
MKTKRILLILLISLFSKLNAQSPIIYIHKFEGDLLCSRLTCDDSAAVISLIEEEGGLTAYVFKITETKLMITIKTDDHDVQYVLNNRYIEKIIEYYPNKTLFYDKNRNPFKPKTGS